MEETTQKKYEMLALLSPELTEKERDASLATIAELLKTNGGKIEDDKAWGMRDLAYTIKKHDRGYYHIWHFWQDGVNLSEIERELNLDNNVLRQMIVAIKDDEKIVIFNDEEPQKPAKREKKDKSESKPKKESKPKVEKKAEAKPEAKKEEKEEPKENIEAVEEKLNKIIDGSDISL